MVITNIYSLTNWINLSILFFFFSIINVKSIHQEMFTRNFIILEYINIRAYNANSQLIESIWKTIIQLIIQLIELKNSNKCFNRENKFYPMYSYYVIYVEYNSLKAFPLRLTYCSKKKRINSNNVNEG